MSKSVTPGKRVFVNRCYTFRDLYLRQDRATREGKRIDLLNSQGDYSLGSVDEFFIGIMHFSQRLSGIGKDSFFCAKRAIFTPITTTTHFSMTETGHVIPREALKKMRVMLPDVH